MVGQDGLEALVFSATGPELHVDSCHVVVVADLPGVEEGLGHRLFNSLHPGAALRALAGKLPAPEPAFVVEQETMHSDDVHLGKKLTSALDGQEWILHRVVSSLV